MKISNNMNLNELADRMGWGSEEVDMESVRTFRDLLVADFDGADTSDVCQNDWLSLLDRSQQL